MDEIKLYACSEPEKFIEILNECIETLEELKEKIIQEVYYDELR